MKTYNFLKELCIFLLSMALMIFMIIGVFYIFPNEMEMFRIQVSYIGTVNLIAIPLAIVSNIISTLVVNKILGK